MAVVLRIVACTFLGLVAQLGFCVQTDESTELAKSAFFAIEANPFSSRVVHQAAKDIGRAAQNVPDDPWVLIATSRLYLEMGYTSGDRAYLESYRADAVERASEYARRAVQYGPRKSMAHVQRARVQIILGDLQGAWGILNTAHALDEKGFYPWYYRGVISLRMKDMKRAGEAFDEAEKAATMPFQKGWVLGRRQNIAYHEDDLATVERIYKELIAMFPANAHEYGNYAFFLKNRRRYDEAIENYEKAIEISPYPIAVEQLKQTLLLKSAAEK